MLTQGRRFFPPLRFLYAIPFFLSFLSTGPFSCRPLFAFFSGPPPPPFYPAASAQRYPFEAPY